ncbi:MAG TPA: response regulator transcription factor [Galbitalea sp.]|jgi:DNA-binding NarL/FixJ family response regulator|nr:response regulator transcription factor [Galbitalea sp.]
MSELIRVVVVDDQAIVREGLVTVLSLLSDIEVLGEAGDGKAAVELVDSLLPDVVLMDLRMPELGGLEATRAITRAHPEIGVLILTTFAEEASVVEVLRAGAKGFLTKDADRAEVAAAVRAVAQGHTTLGGELGAQLVAGRSAASERRDLAARFNLTPREEEVLALIGKGLSNNEIAAKLFVGIATVKTHINAIFAKLGVRDRAQAMALLHSS